MSNYLYNVWLLLLNLRDNFSSFLDKIYTEKTKNPTGIAKTCVCRNWWVVPDALPLKYIETRIFEKQRDKYPYYLD